MQSVTKKRVGILRGGMGEEYNSSLVQGANLIAYFSENLSEKYKIVDVLVDKAGVWHINGLPIKPAELMHRVDIVWNVSEPKFISMLQEFSIPMVGISSFANGIGSNRKLLEEHIKNLGLRMPKHIVFPLYQEDFDGPKENYANKKAQEVFQKFAGPWIVRSLTKNSEVAVHVAKSVPDLARAIEDIMVHKQSILVEELVMGKVTAVHSLLGFRNEDIYNFPLNNLGINFSIEEKQKLNTLTKKLHNHLGEHPYLKSHFLITPRGSIYLTGVLFHPNLKKGSHFDEAVESVGAKMHHIVEHMIERVKN